MKTVTFGRISMVFLAVWLGLAISGCPPQTTNEGEYQGFFEEGEMPEGSPPPAEGEAPEEGEVAQEAEAPEEGDAPPQEGEGPQEGEAPEEGASAEGEGETPEAEAAADGEAPLEGQAEGEVEAPLGLAITHPRESYAPPYLLDFSFSLRDTEGNAVVRDPGDFAVEATENGEAISASETNTLLAKAANRERKCVLVLDYTESMVDAGAIAAMEDAAVDFVRSLNVDAQAALYEFHREDVEPELGLVTGFTTDKDYLEERIRAIWDEHVAGYPASTRCWDTVHTALGLFGQSISNDEQRLLLFLSDGNDESSLQTPGTIIRKAKQRGAGVYAIGFGASVNQDGITQITSECGGAYYWAEDAASLAGRFAQIRSDLDGQYTLRWASIKRGGAACTPAFALALNNVRASHAGTAFQPDALDGDVLEGVLRIPEYAIQNGRATIFIRAFYVPRHVREMAFHLSSDYVDQLEEVELAGAQDGGLCAHWIGPFTEDDGTGQGVFIGLESEDTNDLSTSIAFGGFGPIVALHFNGLPEGAKDLIESITIDNTRYRDDQQHFIIEGY